MAEVEAETPATNDACCANLSKAPRGVHEVSKLSRFESLVLNMGRSLRCPRIPVNPSLRAETSRSPCDQRVLPCQEGPS